MASIDHNSSVSIVMAAGFVGTIFAGLNYIQPTIRTIERNESKITQQGQSIDSLEDKQEQYNDHILEISKALSRIEGRLQELDKNQ